MSDEQSNFNLLSDSDVSEVLDGSWHSVTFGTKKVEFGTPYTLSVTYDSSADGLWFQARFNYWTTGGEIKTLSDTPQMVCAKGKHVATATIPSFDRPDDFAKAVYMVQAGDISGKGTIEVSRPMLVEGDTPAAWAPAEGETLAGGGALMSANLLDGLTPNVREGAVSADGTLHFPARASSAARNVWLFYDLQGQSALKENQTYHVGVSLRGASASGDHLRPFIGYKDAAGNKNWVLTPFLSVGTSWGRAEGTLVVPSGMTPFRFGVQVIGTCPETWMAAPVLSLGSPVVLASSAHTPYATQDHLRSEYATKAALKVTSDAVTAEVTERGKLAGRVGTLESTSGTHTSKLEQLAASIKSLVKGESTYTDPDGRSATSGIYSLVTQTRDSVTALFGSYTKTADMQSQIATAKSQATSAANSATDSKLSSYTKTADLASTTAVKDAKRAGTDAASAASAAQSTADSAKGTADSLATMIRQDADGVTVGKSADGKTWSTTRTRMGASAFEVLTKAGEVASSFGEKVIELGKNSQDAVIRMLGGLVTIKATSAGVSDGAWCEISTDEFVSTNGYHASRIAAGYKDETGFIPQGVAEVMVEGGEGDGGVLMYAGAHGSEGNSFAMSPAAYTLNHPEYLLATLMDASKVPESLDTCGPGVFTYNTSTAARPTDYGTCVCIRAGGGNWLFEFALPTAGDPLWRRNINGAGWSSWWTITSQ